MEFEAALATTTDARGVFGAPLTYVEETGSTNDLAMRAADVGAPEGATFVAGAQRAGRGRLGRTWFSPPGAGLYVSIVLRNPAVAPWITLAGGVAVAEGIRAATGLPVEIKWPNDVIAVTGGAFERRRKLAGILTEASTGAEGLQYIVLGFGINLRPAAFPPELADRATSIETELGRAVEPGRVLASVLAALNGAVGDGLADAANRLLPRWRALSPSATGAAIEWDAPGGVRRGVTAGLAPDGALLARDAHGTERIRSGEVRWA